VAIADIDRSAAQRTAAELRTDDAAECISIQADVTDQQSVGAAARQVDEIWGGLDILVNNAGYNSSFLMADMPLQEWNKVISINLTGPFVCIKECAPYLRRSGAGRIVNIASVAAKRISNHGMHYTAAKAGLVALTRHVAYELADDGVTANAICPGPTLTPLLRSLTTDTELAERVKDIPLGHLIDTSELASTVAFLCRADVPSITGQAIDVDAGVLLGWQPLNIYKERISHAP
jgi:NAD(P)-dependent dehydrogenase (short-subunit alcohol dehydrogenase family)